MFETYFDDDRDFRYSTDSEWDHAEALELGAQYPERAWIGTDRDVWHANPFYKGAPVPHPEDHEWEQSDYNNPTLNALDPDEVNLIIKSFDDDIPF